MPAGSKQRESRERTRLYQARRAFHHGQSRRRSRDNFIAAVVGGILILGVVAGQVAFYTIGPGVPSPSPTPVTTDVPTAPPLPIPTPAPTP